MYTALLDAIVDLVITLIGSCPLDDCCPCIAAGDNDKSTAEQ